MTYFINDKCIDEKDQSCVAQCPVDCIYEGPRSMYINPEECIDCGACELVCPVSAIAYDAELNEAGAALVADTSVWMLELQAVGGARRRGPLDQDRVDLHSVPPAASA